MMQVLMRLMILLSAVSAPIAAHAQPSQDHLYGWHGGGDWGHMMFGPLMMLVFVAVVIVVVVLAVRWLGGAGHVWSPDQPQRRKTARTRPRWDKHARTQLQSTEQTVEKETYNKLR
jgi:uncharacterized membrane protein